MRPSNHFEDITEDEFNRREMNKNSYKNDLFQQMQESRGKKEADRRRRLQEELIEEEKVKAQLRQIGEEFNRQDSEPKKSGNFGGGVNFG